MNKRALVLFIGMLTVGAALRALPIHETIENRDLTEKQRLEEVLRLVEQDQSNVNARDPQHQISNTPLHVAVLYGDVAIIKFLLEHGASVNTPNAAQETPLHVAIYPQVNPEVIKLLLENGADIWVKNSFQKTPMLKAVELSQRYHSSTASMQEAVALLLPYGCVSWDTLGVGTSDLSKVKNFAYSDDIMKQSEEAPSFRLSLFGLYDGQGGSAAAQFAKKELLPAIRQEIKDKNDIRQGIAAGFQSVKEKFLTKFPAERSKSSLVVAVMSHEWHNYLNLRCEKNMLYLAQAGDSRVVLENNGSVQDLGKKPSVHDILGAFGRRGLGSTLMSASPEVSFVELKQENHFMIFASKEVLEKLGEKLAVETVDGLLKRGLTLKQAAEGLTIAAERKGAQGNLAVMVIGLRQSQKQAPEKVVAAKTDDIDNECPVCLEEETDFVCPGCKKKFHRACWCSSVKQFGACPMCQRTAQKLQADKICE